MKTLKITSIVLFCLINLMLVSCSPTPTPTATCNSVNTDFQQLYTATLASNTSFSNYTTMDLVTHEYTFIVNVNKQVCTIGYQGNAILFANNIPYKIEIVDNSTSTIIYSGNHIFNSTTTDYQSIPLTSLTAGTSYTIKRTVTNFLGNVGNTIGRICRFAPAPQPFPVTFGVLTITSSNFYGSGGPVPNFGIPYIDIVLQ
jgi:hypothetical protein